MTEEQMNYVQKIVEKLPSNIRRSVSYGHNQTTIKGNITGSVVTKIFHDKGVMTLSTLGREPHIVKIDITDTVAVAKKIMELADEDVLKLHPEMKKCKPRLNINRFE